MNEDVNNDGEVVVRTRVKNITITTIYTTCTTLGCTTTSTLPAMVSAKLTAPSLQAELTSMGRAIRSLTWSQWGSTIVVILYAAIITPANTPHWFAHPIAKTILLGLVFLVAVGGEWWLALLFSLAIGLTIVYAELNRRNACLSDDDTIESS